MDPALESLLMRQLPIKVKASTFFCIYHLFCLFGWFCILKTRCVQHVLRLQGTEAKPLVIQAHVVQRELESCWRREHTAAILPLLLDYVPMTFNSSSRLILLERKYDNDKAEFR